MVDMRGVQSRVTGIVKGSRDLLVGSAWRHEAVTSTSCPPFDLNEPWYYDLSRSLARGDYGTRDDVDDLPATTRDGAWSHQPALVLSYGIASLQQFVTADDTVALVEAIRVANWAQGQQNSTVLHFVPMRFALPGLPANWPCSMVQGLALSLFARLAFLRNDDQWLTQAVAGLGIFETDIADGGVRSRPEVRGIWYEEYPYRKGGSHVLNGFIYSLFGLRDVALLQREGSDRASRLFDEGLESLRRALPSYDSGFWSRYDLPEWRGGRLASQYYHRTHIALLNVLSVIDPECGLWLEYRDRFTTYGSRATNRLYTLTKKLRDTSST